MLARSAGVALMTLIALASVCVAADLPEKLRRDLDEGQAVYEKKWKESQEELGAAFVKEIERARTAAKLSGEEKQRVIGALEAEKAIFEKSGELPFSPRMRSATIHFLNAVQKADKAVAKIYDKAIELRTKQKDDDSARELVAEKKKLLEPKVAAKWLNTFPSGFVFTETLLTNGEMPNGTWTLDQEKVVTNLPDKAAPGGAWINTYIVKTDGLSADAQNHKGSKFTGKRVIE